MYVVIALINLLLYNEKARGATSRFFVDCTLGSRLLLAAEGPERRRYIRFQHRAYALVGRKETVYCGREASAVVQVNISQYILLVEGRGQGAEAAARNVQGVLGVEHRAILRSMAVAVAPGGFVGHSFTESIGVGVCLETQLAQIFFCHSVSYA